MPYFTLTDSALKQAKKFQVEQPEYAGLALRIYLSGKGCDGFDYGVCFDKPAADDVVEAHGDLSVIADPESLKFVRGSNIEWINDERGQGFLVENPNHKKFRGKFYKRKDWQERLGVTSEPV